MQFRSTQEKKKFIESMNFFAGQFDPRAISGLKVWLDANDLSTITKDGSNLVSAFNDKSGSGYNVTAAGANRPLYVSSAYNNKSILRSPGIMSCGAITELKNVSAFTMLQVAKGVQSGNYNSINNRTMISNNGSGLLNYGIVSASAQMFGRESSVNAFGYSAIVFDGTLIGSGNRLKTATNINQTLHAFASYPISPIPALSENASIAFAIFNNNGAALPAGSDFGEFLLYNRALSQYEILNLFSYFQSWGL